MAGRPRRSAAYATRGATALPRGAAPRCSGATARPRPSQAHATVADLPDGDVQVRHGASPVTAPAPSLGGRFRARRHARCGRDSFPCVSSHPSRPEPAWCVDRTQSVSDRLSERLQQSANTRTPAPAGGIVAARVARALVEGQPVYGWVEGACTHSSGPASALWGTAPRRRRRWPTCKGLAALIAEIGAPNEITLEVP